MSDLKTHDLTNSKTFRRKVKPLFSEKSIFTNKAYTYGKGGISNEAKNPSEIKTVISDDREVAEHLTIFL